MKTAKDRINQIDILRFLAVILVIIFHADPIPNYYNPIIKTIWNFFSTIGWIGVDLFFVLSGFLVSGLIFNEFKKTEKFSIKQFLIRRGLKIYPAFWVLIFFTVIVKIITEKRFEIEKFIGEMLFIQNYLRNKDFYYWGHTWSLAIEEHFYIGLSLLCFYLIAKTKKKLDLIPSYFVFIAIFCLALRIFFVFYNLDKPTLYSTYYYCQHAK
jgi:peptidoglycan/LPS O-acetylase OafA/YrhL